VRLFVPHFEKGSSTTDCSDRLTLQRFDRCRNWLRDSNRKVLHSWRLGVSGVYVTEIFRSQTMPSFWSQWWVTSSCPNPRQFSRNIVVGFTLTAVRIESHKWNRYKNQNVWKWNSSTQNFCFLQSAYYTGRCFWNPPRDQLILESVRGGFNN